MGNEAGALMHKCRYKVFLITHELVTHTEISFPVPSAGIRAQTR